MMTTYYNYEAVSKAPTFAAWNNTWPGYDGCSARSVWYTSYQPNQPPSPGSPQYYDPEQTTRWRGSGRSGRRLGNPPFGFTDYSVGRRTIRQYLIRKHMGSRGVNRYYQFGRVIKVVTTCTPTVDNVTCSGPVWSTYDVVSRNFYGLSTYVESELNEGEVTSATNDVQNEMIAESASSYDVLTDIAQARDVPKMIIQISKDIYNILGTLRGRHGRAVMRAAHGASPLDLLRNPNKWLRKFGKEWMTYRYGIMPLVYSYRDLLKTMNRGYNVKTRKSRTISPKATGQTMPASSNTYWKKSTIGSVTVRGEVFQHFTSDEIARLSGLGFNPLVTAWELIPYSFVVDWFVNVGDYIATRASQTWAQQKWACISRRDQYTKQTWLHKPNEDQSIVIDNLTPVGWWGSAPPATPNQIMKNPEGFYIFEEEEVDTYSRGVIPVVGAPLRFKPSLNWRRLVDAAAMSLNQLGRLARSFR